METTPNNEALIVAANAEVLRMRGAISRLEADGTVTMRRNQFINLAALIERLAALSRCDEDSFNPSVDGVRWWVPLPEFERTLAELDDLRGRYYGISFEPNNLSLNSDRWIV